VVDNVIGRVCQGVMKGHRFERCRGRVGMESSTFVRLEWILRTNRQRSQRVLNLRCRQRTSSWFGIEGVLIPGIIRWRRCRISWVGGKMRAAWSRKHDREGCWVGRCRWVQRLGSWHRRRGQSVGLADWKTMKSVSMRRRRRVRTLGRSRGGVGVS
jgi:hypothetical protein